MQQSLFASPEVYANDDIVTESVRYIDDEEVLLVAGDVPEDVTLEDYEAVAVHACYS